MSTKEEINYLNDLRRTLKDDIRAFLDSRPQERDKAWSTGFGTVCLAFTEAGNRIDKLNKKLGIG